MTDPTYGTPDPRLALEPGTPAAVAPPSQLDLLVRCVSSVAASTAGAVSIVATAHSSDTGLPFLLAIVFGTAAVRVLRRNVPTNRGPAPGGKSARFGATDRARIYELVDRGKLTPRQAARMLGLPDPGDPT